MRGERSIRALDELATALREELADREWYKLNGGFGTGAFLDFTDAEIHLRALYRIIATNEPIETREAPAP